MDSPLTAFEEYLGIVNPYCDVATYALIGYEFFLTCDEEINFLRAKNKRIIAMLLFLANRLSLIGYAITEPVCTYTDVRWVYHSGLYRRNHLK
ncbi:hypothetical protein DAEQUDRAFT_394487 [Daedalea quercina L-15889]|uniref:DUF6533 domain-containing protein n=1 Tax=Daedalea quercina L-15889 TaxID=1314783 RepID=A0A165NWX3_9APHY|nr:hypothetical protein DAEQUDRAFT_394487 [Daedalea quercina L-15889]